MSWPWQRTVEIKRQRDHALVRAVQMEARLRDLGEERERLQAELRETKQALERVVDNALFAAGAAPVFRPEDKRFQPRSVEQQTADAASAKPPLSAAEWRHKLEQADVERTARERKARLAEELEKLAEQRKRGKANGEA